MLSFCWKSVVSFILIFLGNVDVLVEIKFNGKLLLYLLDGIFLVVRSGIVIGGGFIDFFLLGLRVFVLYMKFVYVWVVFGEKFVLR